MTKIVLSAELFRAVATATSTDATRFYLQGVYVEPVVIEGAVIAQVRITATDGNFLMTSQHTRTDAEPFRPFIVQITKQSDDILKACRAAKAPTLTLDTDSRVWTTENVHGAELALGRWQEVEGTFPEYRRVIPSDTSRGQAGPGCVAFSAKTLARLAAAGQALALAPLTFSFSEKQPAKAPILLHFGTRDDVLGVVMPALDAPARASTFWCRS